MCLFLYAFPVLALLESVVFLPKKIIKGGLEEGMEKAVAPQSSVLAWRIAGTGEPGGLPSVGSHKSRTQQKRLSSGGSRIRNGLIFPCS